VNERRESDRLNKSFNTNFGMEWYLTKSITWTNQFRLRNSSGDNPEKVFFRNYDENNVFQSASTRFSAQENDNEEIEYSTNFVKKFKKEGHTLTIDGSFSQEESNDLSDINTGQETVANIQEQNDNEIDVNYVLPLWKDSQFEAGYSGDFRKQVSDFENSIFNNTSGETDFTNSTLEYKEKINALFTQYGTKFNKFSVLLGLRWEDTNIEINELTTRDFNNKRYSNFFPSVFLTYELSERSSVSLSYSRRISRPRGRQINPFPNRSSNINIFQGNPDLDAAFSNAFDLGYLQRWNNLTLSTSLYLNRTTDSFQFIRRESGDFVTTQVVGQPDITDEHGQIITIIEGEDVITPVILSTPINLATEYRFGFEFTLNYTPFKWWKLNSNFNFFRNETQGDYTYTSFDGDAVTQDFDNTAYSWFTRLTSRVTLPYKIEWQTNFTYNGPQTTAQGKSYGIAAANLAFSKDILKDKATIALNVQDVFNSRKRIFDTYIPGRLESHSEQQWRVRSINVSFTYRFNKKKSEREKQPQRENENGGDEMFQG
jgi:outer membrane receptor protein involved in Fe transport